MDKNKLIAIGLVGSVCCCVVAGVAATASITVKYCASVIDSVVTNCVPLVDSLVDNILHQDK